jgi:hypothetical protein
MATAAVVVVVIYLITRSWVFLENLTIIQLFKNSPDPFFNLKIHIHVSTSLLLDPT